jgi:hypothetical protein
MRWRLILEEYGPELVYVKGEHNVVADALSRLELTIDTNPSKPTLNYMSEIFGLSKDDIPSTIYPLKYSFLEQEQHKDKDLMTNIGKDSSTFRFKAFLGGQKAL